MKNDLDVSIVIVNWKVKNLLSNCLTSIYRYTKNLNFEVFVIDNDSNDGSVEMIQNDFSQVHLIANEQNYGFAKAQNTGIIQSNGKYVFILNPDIEFIDNAPLTLYEWMEKKEHQKVAILGPSLLYTDQTPQATVKRLPTFFSQFLVLLKLHHIFSWSHPIQRYLAKDFDYRREQKAEQIMGAAMFFRGEILRKKLKGFDEDFWIWFEDIDLCKRSLDLGYEVYYTPNVRIIHHEGKSFGQVLAPQKQKFFNRSLRVYAKKHFGIFPYIVFCSAHPFSMLLSYIVALFHIGPKPQSRI